MRKRIVVISILACFSLAAAFAQGPVSDSSKAWEKIVREILNEGLKDCRSYTMLQELTSKAPVRMSGSPDYNRAAEITKTMMMEKGFDRVRYQQVLVPFWHRGRVESARLLESGSKKEVSLSICSLGGSVGTHSEGIVGEVLEVQSFDELTSLAEMAKGRIVFFNRRMDPSKLNTREAYRGAVNQRNLGAIEASKVGAVAVLVRSMTLAVDDVPHAGAVNYNQAITKIPAAAISIHGANLLSRLLEEDRKRLLRLDLSCKNMGEVQSVNVIGEIRGRERPEEVVLLGAHLDSWDRGSGAHDDGAGCAQVIEALDLIQRIGLHPKRTIRVVLFENEEMGARGGLAYRDSVRFNHETHVAAIESDHGGFAPRGFAFEGNSPVVDHVLRLKHVFDEIEAGRFVRDHPGVDIMPLVQDGVAGFGLDPENHRYFDYHHSDNDTIDKVHPRELELGAIAIAILALMISEM